MPSPFVLCDVFTSRPFAGNPLAVFLRGGDFSDEQMQALSQEFGWSEITFALKGERRPRIRIWTPQGELPFAGHPTVGTAVVLAAEGEIAAGWSVLDLGIGPVPVDVTLTGREGGRAVMTQRTPRFGHTFDSRAELARSLGLEEGDLSAQLPAQIVSTGIDHFLVPICSLEALGRARPIPDLLPPILTEVGARWAYLFSVETPGSIAAARARLLAPGMEDAATGSAAGPLGAYLV